MTITSAKFFIRTGDGIIIDIPKESNFDKPKKSPDKLVIFTLSKSTYIFPEICLHEKHDKDKRKPNSE